MLPAAFAVIILLAALVAAFIVIATLWNDIHHTKTEVVDEVAELGRQIETIRREWTAQRDSKFGERLANLEKKFGGSAS